MATVSHLVAVYAMDALSDAKIERRLTDDDNYMLKSASSGVASVASETSVRPRSASLSQVSSASAHCNVVLQQVAKFLTASGAKPSGAKASGVKTSEVTPTPYAALICSCLPGCCCKCSLLSSLAECQAVYHHVCARHQLPASDAALSGCSVSGAGDADSLPPPPTVPQDVVSSIISFFFFLL